MSDEIERLRYQAKRAMQNGLPDKAADALNALVLLEGDNLKYRHFAVDMCMGAKRLEEAAAHLWYLTQQHLSLHDMPASLNALDRYRTLSNVDKQEGLKMFNQCRANQVPIGQCLQFLNLEDRLVYALRAHPMFSALEEKILEEVLAACVLISAGDGERVVKEGEEGDYIFIVVQGGLRPIVRDEDAVPYEMATYGPGSFSGEGAFLTQQHVRTANLLAKDNTLLYSIPYAVLENISSKCPQFLRVMKEQYQANGAERLLAKTPFFRHYSLEERRKIAAQMEPLQVQPSDVLFDYGERSNLDFYVVQSGLISLSVSDNGREQYLRTAKAGDVVGELGVLYNIRKFRAHAVSDVCLMRWPEACYRQFYMQDQKMRQWLLERADSIKNKLH